MQFLLKYEQFKNINEEPLIIEDLDGCLIMTIEAVINGKNIKYLVKDSNNIVIYTIKKENPDNYKKFTVVDNDDVQVAVIRKGSSIYRPADIVTVRDIYLQKTYLRDLTMKMFKNDNIIIYSFSEKRNGVKYLLNTVYDSGDILFALSIYLSIGIMYSNNPLR